MSLPMAGGLDPSNPNHCVILWQDAAHTKSDTSDCISLLCVLQRVSFLLLLRICPSPSSCSPGLSFTRILLKMVILLWNLPYRVTLLGYSSWTFPLSFARDIYSFAFRITHCSSPREQTPPKVLSLHSGHSSMFSFPFLTASLCFSCLSLHISPKGTKLTGWNTGPPTAVICFARFWFLQQIYFSQLWLSFSQM